MTNTRKLAVIVFGGLIAACLYHCALMGALLHRDYPQNTFLFNNDWLFSDFYETVKLASTGNPYSGAAVLNSVYPPALNLAALLLARQPFLRPSDLYLLLAALVIGAAGWLVFREKDPAKTALNVLGGAFASYPVIYLLHRGNLELIAFPCLFAGIYFYDKKKYAAAALGIGLAAACKVYPAIFFFLFVTDRKMRWAALSAAICAAVTVAGFMYFHNGLAQNISAMLATMRAYNAEYVGKGYGLVFGHSLYGALQAVRCWILGIEPVYSSPRLIKFYPYIAAALGLFTLRRVWLEKELWKKVALLTAAMLALPYVSADYRLISLFAPLYLYFKAGYNGRYACAYLWIFGLLLVPKNFLYFCEPEVSLSAALNPLLLGALAALIVREQIAGRKATVPDGAPPS
ncbi:MAG: glycosyltransferase 87 family protein [Elusimicrobiaceae bacterium]|nr:glycosyltransferase 87 family protein [Elusimicrobiaceae bacterium]